MLTMSSEALDILEGQTSSYTSGHLEVSKLDACLEKLHFLALLVMSKFSRICFSFDFKSALHYESSLCSTCYQNALVVHSQSKKTSEEKVSEEEAAFKVEVLIQTQHYRSPTPLNLVLAQDFKQPTMVNITSKEGKLNLDDVKAQMEEMRRLAFLKKEKEKTEKKLKKLTPAEI
ncbi:hypothetical protein Tco_0364377 [Tanacetum coccineum]